MGGWVDAEMRKRCLEHEQNSIRLCWTPATNESLAVYLVLRMMTSGKKGTWSLTCAPSDFELRTTKVLCCAGAGRREAVGCGIYSYQEVLLLPCD